MNSLSWLIYLAGIVKGITAFLAVFGVLGLCASIFSILYQLDVYKKVNNFKTHIFFAVSFFLFIWLSCLIPNKETIYLIATSEIGETVINSELAQELLNKVQEALK